MNDETPSRFWLRLTSPLAAALILVLFWLFMLVSLSNKSLTSDEIVHVTSGYTYWKFNDYRLNPENGNLPQRVMAIPFLWSDFKFPSTDSAAWRGSDEWGVGDQWFHALGNDVGAMLWRGRAASGLMAVALGFLVWWYARRLFGPMGGLISLGLFVLSPSILANGALMTSDTACALFFLAATMSWWDVLHRLSPGRLAASAFIMGGLFVSKMSAVLIIPIGATLVIARLIDGRPLPVTFGRSRDIAGRWAQAGAYVVAALVHAGVVVLVIWAFFGFRYSVFADRDPSRDHLYDTWEHLSDKPLMPQVLADLHLTDDQDKKIHELLVERAVPFNKWTLDALAFLPVIEKSVLTPGQSARLEADMAAPPPGVLQHALYLINRAHLLPEGYVFGQVFSLKFSKKRGSFFNGEFGLFGWRSFFPYTVLVKTPLTVFAIALLAAGAAFLGWRLGQGPPGKRIVASLYATLPLWVLLAFYWTALITSHINIGHRHILATYPPLFVLCGAAAGWLRPAGYRAAKMALGASFALLAAEVLYRFPNYLAYFNLIAGGPEHAYRHLVDSSLDWGQDLPGVGEYIRDHQVKGRAYMSYFGSASPQYYHTPVQLLYTLEKPMRLMTVPAAEAESATQKMLAEHPEYDVAATGEQGGQAAIMFLERPSAFRLEAGTYFISATMLQPLEYDPPGPWGPWNDHYEAKYQELRELAKPFLSDDQPGRLAALQAGSVYDWQKALNDFDMFRFARLTAYLRNREPDDWVGYSILVYRLSAADLEKALEGPDPEHGPDVLKMLEATTDAGRP